MVAIARLFICPFCINYINYKAVIKNSEVCTVQITWKKLSLPKKQGFKICVFIYWIFYFCRLNMDAFLVIYNIQSSGSQEKHDCDFLLQLYNLNFKLVIT